MNNGYSKRDIVLGVRVSQEERDAFIARADRKNVTLATWVRTLLRRCAGLPVVCEDYVETEGGGL